MVINLVLAPAFWLWLDAGPVAQLLWLAIIGLALGANYPTVVLLAHDAWPQRIALASGLVMGLGWAPAGPGASFTGYLADQTSLPTAMTTLVVPALLAALCVLLYRVWLKPRIHTTADLDSNGFFTE